MNEHEKEFLEGAAKDFEQEFESKKNIKSNLAFFSVCIVLIIITAILGFFIFKDLGKERELYNSLNSMKNKKTEEIDMKIYSKDNYAKVEKIIKEAYKEYTKNYNNLNTLYKELNTTNFLNVEIYKKEKDTSFFMPKKRLKENTDKRNEAIKNIEKLYSQETIQKNIKNNNFNEYFSKLYIKILNELNFKNHVDSIRKYEVNINAHIQSINDIYDYLISNKDKWEITENQLVSYYADFITEFNQKIATINKKK